jgi:hypothetical protein
MADLYLALLHYPVYDKDHKVVTTSITNMDIHDIARSACTYGVKRYFIATPIRTLRALSQKILDHWQSGYGSVYNETRKTALSLVALADDLEDVARLVEKETGEKPRIVVTSARFGPRRSSFAEVSQMLQTPGAPLLLVLGTGWGLVEEILAKADLILEPIQGTHEYNHLSVRAAAAIMLDRLRHAR